MGVIFVHSEIDDLGLDPFEFRVYAHLARRAGSGSAWPSHEAIADATKISRVKVIACLTSLEALGLIEVTRRTGTSNTYTLTKKSAWGVFTRKTPPVHQVDGGCSPGEHKGYPGKDIQLREPPTSPKGEECDSLSLKIYEAYPKRVARRAALKAIAAARKRGHPPDFLLGKTQAYAKSCAGKDVQFIPYPATWFNGDRFMEEFTVTPAPARKPLRSDLRFTIDLLRREIAKHPGNPDCINHSDTPENRAAYTNLKQTLKQAEQDYLSAQ